MTINGKDISIREIMRDTHTIEVGKNLREALRELIAQRTNSLLVVDADGKLVGMVNAHALISEVVPDYLEGDQVAAHFASEDMFREEAEKVTDTPLENFMIKDPATVTVNDSLMKAAVLAVANKENVRIPVVDENHKPLGILTRTEIKQVIGAYLGIDGCFED